MSESFTEGRVPSSQIKSYYGGNRVNNDAGVIPLNAKNFTELHHAYLLTPLRIRATREEFTAMPKKQRNEAKSGPYITAASFSGPGARTAERMVSCSLVALDVDDSESAFPFLKNGGDAVKDIPWNFVIHHTLSSTPEAPRIRILVDAETFDPKYYRRAVAYVAAALGIPDVDPASSTPNQPMYRPTTCADEDKSPIIACRLEGGHLPLAEFRDFSLSEAVDGLPDEDFSALVSTQPPIPNVSDETVVSMIEKLDPDDTYEKWLRVLCALRHQYGQKDEEESERGFGIFDEWSQKGRKYTDRDDAYTKWRSFKPSTASGKSVTLRSVIKMAQDAGWESEEFPKVTVETLCEAIKNEQKLSNLTEKHLPALAAATHLQDTLQDMVLNALSAKMSELNGKVGVPSLRRTVRKLRQEALLKNPPVMPGWMQDLAFLSTKNMFVNARKGLQFPVEGFNGEYLIEHQEFSGPDSGTPAEAAIRTKTFPRVHDWDYMPEREGEHYVDVGGKMFINTYQATYPRAESRTSKEAGSILERHCMVNFKDEELVKYLISFLAHIVQYPGQKIKWAIFMQGVQGSGKSIYGDIMQKVLGDTNYNVVDHTKLASNYTDWYEGSQFLLFDEILTGDNRKEQMNRLKQIIAADYVSLTRKYKGSANVLNRTNSFFVSNYDDGLRIDDSDRRYFILKSVFQTKPQLEAFKKENPWYLTNIWRLTTDLTGGIRDYLLNYPIYEKFNKAGPAPDSPFRATVVDAGRAESDYAFLKFLRDGEHPLVARDLVSFSVLRKLMRDAGERATAVKSVAKLLVSHGFHDYGQHSLGRSERHSIWVHQDYDEMLYDAPEEEMRERMRKFNESQTEIFNELPS